MDLFKLKQQTHEACLHLLTEKISALELELKHYQQASSEETKSSAGDKYETGREMLNLEKEKITSQLDQLVRQVQIMERIDPSAHQKEVGSGTLVKTNLGIFYVSVGVGELKLEDRVYCISPLAPLCAAMMGKTKMNETTFNGRKVVIEDLI